MSVVRRSWWRLLLVGMLTPLVILSSTATATAAAGDWVGVQWGLSAGLGDISPVSLTCGANFGMGASSGAVTLYVRDGYCKGGADITPGVCQLGEASCTSVSLSVTGPGCSVSLSPATYEGPNDGWGSTDMRWDMATASVGLCDPTEACISATSDTMIGGTTASACQPIDLDPPNSGPSNDGCPDGVPAGAMTANFSTASWPGAPYRDLNWSVTLDAQPVMIPFRVVIWYTSNGVLQHHVTDIQYAGPGNGLVKSGKVGPSWDGGQTLVVKGVQMVIFGAAMNGSDEWGNVGNNGTWDYNVPIMTGPPGTAMGGAHWPERCTFYYGDKIGNTSGDEHDEPGSDMSGGAGGGSAEPGGTADPIVDEATPDTETGLLDWLAGLLRALIAAVWKLVGLIGGLASAIWGLFESGLSALFVPDGAFFSDTLDGVKNAWADTPPMVVMDSVADVGDALTVSSPGGGCAGPDLSFTEPVGGRNVTLNPFSACGDGTGMLATITKTALTIFVYVGGFLVAARMIGSSFGLDVSIGRGGGDS